MKTYIIRYFSIFGQNAHLEGMIKSEFKSEKAAKRYATMHATEKANMIFLEDVNATKAPWITLQAYARQEMETMELKK